KARERPIALDEAPLVIRYRYPDRCVLEDRPEQRFARIQRMHQSGALALVPHVDDRDRGGMRGQRDQLGMPVGRQRWRTEIKRERAQYAATSIENRRRPAR